MITSKKINAITAVAMVFALLLSCFAMVAPKTAQASATAAQAQLTYSQQLFGDTVMAVDISVDETSWNTMLENALNEEYISCDVTINGVTYTSVGVRPKGNSSLTQIASDSTTDRYSFKLEFDHYIKNQTCCGLDKLVLNNMQSDATYMKEYLSYQLMDYIGVTSPLYTFANITVNGESWGFYLAIEALEESFALRSYGADYGQLYKPEGMDMGGGGMGGQEDGMKPGNFPGQGQNGWQSDENSGQEDEAQTASSAASGPQGLPPGGGQGPGGRPGMGGGQNGNTPPDDATSGAQGNFMSAQGEIPAVTAVAEQQTAPQMPGDFHNQENGMPQMPGDGENGQSGMPQFPGNAADGQNGMPQTPGGMGGSGGGSDLVYIDDQPESYSDIFDNAVFDAEESDYQRVITALEHLNDGSELEQYVDVDQVLRYFAANTVLVNLDSYVSSLQHNYYLYEKGGQISILPWDFNLSFAAFQSGSASAAVNFPIDTPVSGVELADRPLLNKLLEVAEYKERYHQYLQEIVDGYFNSGLFANTIDLLDAQISTYVQNDPSAFYTYEQYQSAVEMLKQYGALRAQSVQGQLDGIIPSTTDGQSADSSALVDASSIDLSIMGMQGGGMGHMGGGMLGAGGGNNGGQADTPANTQPGESDETDTVGGFGGAPGMMEGGFGADMPDQSVTRQAMEIIAQSDGTLTEEQLRQLSALGLTEEQISMLQTMAQGFGGTRGEPGGFPGGAAGETAWQPGELAAGKGQPAGVSADWLIVCLAGVACLVAGLIFVALFRRRRYAKGRPIHWGALPD